MASEEQKDTAARLNAIKSEQALQRDLTKILQTKVTKSGELTKVQQELVDELKGQKDLESKLLTIQQKKEEIIEKYTGANEDLRDRLLEQLEHVEKIVKTEKERKDLSEEINDIGKDFVSDLGQSVGLSKELSDAIKTASIAAIGLVILKEIADYIAGAVKRMRDLTKETGASWKQAMQLEGAIKGAQLSIGPLKYSYEEVAASAEALREATGQIVPDPSLLADITEVNALLSDPKAATSLTRTLKNAGVDAGELTEEITKMASKMGQDAGPAMEYLAANQLQLNGMSKEQIKLKAKEAIEMKKMGVDMQKMVDLASEQLDIESSLKNEMKLQTMLGKDISFNELRAAQASGDAFAVAQAQKKLVDQLGTSLEGNLQVQRIISEQTGLTKDEMLNIKNATNEATTAGQEMGDAPKETLSNLGQIVTVLGLVAAGGLVVYGILLAMGKVKLPFTGGGGKKSNPIANFIGGFGTSDVLKGAAAMLLVAASMFVMALAISKMPTEPGPYIGMAVGLGIMLGALYLLAEFPTADLLKGALALAVVGVSLIPFAYAMSLIAGIEIGAILAVAAGIAIFAAEIMLLGAIMFSGIGALIFGAGIVALLSLGAAMIVLGSGIVIFNKGVSGLGDNITVFAEKMAELISIAPTMLGAVVPLVMFGIALIPFALGLAMAAVPMIAFGTGILILSNGLSKLGENIGSLQSLASVTPMLAQLVGLIPGLIALSGAFYLLSGSLISLSLGLSTIALLLPVLSILGTLLPTVSAAFGGDGGESAKESSNGGGVSMKEVVEEIKGLRSDIQAQPIMINVDGRVVSEITKVQSRKLSTRKSGYGG